MPGATIMMCTDCTLLLSLQSDFVSWCHSAMIVLSWNVMARHSCLAVMPQCKGLEVAWTLYIVPLQVPGRPSEVVWSTLMVCHCMSCSFACCYLMQILTPKCHADESEPDKSNMGDRSTGQTFCVAVMCLILFALIAGSVYYQLCTEQLSSAMYITEGFSLGSAGQGARRSFTPKTDAELGEPRGSGAKRRRVFNDPV